MAEPWLAACRSCIEMINATDAACDPDLKSKTEQHGKATLMKQLQQVSSLKAEDITLLGKILKEAQLPSEWGRDLMRAAAQRKLDLNIEAKPDKDREKQGQSCPWIQNYRPERIWLTLMDPATPMPVGLRLLDTHAASLGLFYADEAFHAFLVGLAALTKRAEIEKPKVFYWLSESKANISNVRPAGLDKRTLCWQFPSSPQEFRKTWGHFYDRTFKDEPPIQCPMNASHTMMYLKSIPQRKTSGVFPSKLASQSPLDSGSAVIPWQTPPRRLGSAAPDASAFAASGSANVTSFGASGSADTETPRFETNEERELALQLGNVVLRAAQKGSFGAAELEEMARLTGKKVNRDIVFGSPLRGRKALALRDRDPPTDDRPPAPPARPEKSKAPDVGDIDADLDKLVGGKPPPGSMKAMKAMKVREEDVEDSDECASGGDESEDSEAKPAKPMKRKAKRRYEDDITDDSEEAKPARPMKRKAMKREAQPVGPMKRKAMKRKAMRKLTFHKPDKARKSVIVEKGSLQFPRTLDTMSKTPPLWYGKSAVYFDVRGGRIRVYAKRGDKVEHTHVSITLATVRKQWAKVKAVLLKLNP